MHCYMVVDTFLVVDYTISVLTKLSPRNSRKPSIAAMRMQNWHAHYGNSRKPFRQRKLRAEAFLLSSFSFILFIALCIFR